MKHRAKVFLLISKQYDMISKHAHA